jgi:FixJ family two-component response regulator
MGATGRISVAEADYRRQQVRRYMKLHWTTKAIAVALDIDVRTVEHWQQKIRAERTRARLMEGDKR